MGQLKGTTKCIVLDQELCLVYIRLTLLWYALLGGTTCIYHYTYHILMVPIYTSSPYHILMVPIYTSSPYNILMVPIYTSSPYNMLMVPTNNPTLIRY